MRALVLLCLAPVTYASITQQTWVAGSAHAYAVARLGYADAGTDSMEVESWARAEASYDADVILTFLGGSGSGFFSTCIVADAAAWGWGVSAASRGEFAGVSAIGTRRSFETCGNALPFVFDVPQTFHMSFTASSFSRMVASDCSAAAFLTGFRVTDLSGSPLNASYSLVEAPVPEPGTVQLISVALLGGVAYRSLRRRTLTSHRY